MATLYEALTGYAEPDAGLLGGPDLLGADGGGAAAGVDEEPREEDFEPILADLQQRADADPAFARKLSDAFRIDLDKVNLHEEIRKSRELVARAREMGLLSAGAVSSDASVLEGPSAADQPELLGVPNNFGSNYIEEHVLERYRKDLDPIELDPKLRRFEDDNTVGILGWLVFNGLGAITVPRSLTPPFPEQFGRIAGAAPFVRHSPADNFVRPLAPGAGDGRLRVALFADFGTGLAHSRFIARQIALNEPAFDAAVHLGDVYYTGTTKQYHDFFEEPLEPVLQNDTKLFVIPDNHDGYSGFHAHVEFMRRRVPHQPASYFAIESKHLQIIGVDTIWHSDRGRIQDPRVLSWLKERFAAGRAAGRTNVLLTGAEPYCYESMDLTQLKDDVLAVAGGALDLWFWGNTHYCALFDRGPNTPFFGSCIGHGGYPYGKQKPLAEAKLSAAPVRFIESGSRYEGSDVRLDRGMNGFCYLEVHLDGTLEVHYRDWRGHERCVATFERQANGALKDPAVQDFTP